MECIGFLHGTAPLIKKYQTSASLTRAGIPLLACAAGEAGLDVGATTAINDMVGCNIDLVTYATAQVAGGSPEGLVSVIINPDAIWKIFMSGAAAAGTAAVERDVTTASTNGLAVTTADAWDSPTTDEGLIWGVSGANAGQKRKITSVSSTAATLTVALANDTVVGDLFSWAPVFPMTLQTVTLCTELDEFRQDVAVAANTAELTCIEFNPNDWLGRAQARPFGLFVAADHILNRES
ncbi:MAG: hypothetical protein AB7I42_26045 [Bradyrhizobium sp.]|uniref:hypothetical protein n=1 Tax=Bradyrhizobium sp. TaxID=376 RepID=UPI003D112192